MKVSVFSYEDYKRYLRDKLDELGENERGWRLKLSGIIGCQPSYLSQVLNGKPDLTLEQAFKVNGAFVHQTDESRYFMLLIELGRAGAQDLKQFYLDQIRELRQSRFNLKKRLGEMKDVPAEAQQKYYSAWFYSAIHIALGVPELQDSQAIARRFNLPIEIVADVVRFLENCGLVENVDGVYRFTKLRLHLDRSSDFIQRHHINWRSQALQSAEKNLPTDLHFSTVFAISLKDFERIKEALIQGIESAREIIRPSPSEEVCAITLDFFKL